MRKVSLSVATISPLLSNNSRLRLTAFRPSRRERIVPLLASRRLVLASIAAVLAALPVVPASAAEPAADLVSSTAQQVVDIVRVNPPGPQRQAAIQQILLTKFDLPYMGQQSLGQFWNRATEPERARFLKAVETAEARAYSERFGQYAGQTVTVGKVTTRPNGLYIVDSKLSQSNGQPVKLEWEVRNSAQGLRITDVKVEGVSMVVTRRSDFNSYIQQNGGKVDALIDALEAKAKGP
jgi:phospholipid transport system substrate-binding protein